MACRVVVLGAVFLVACWCPASSQVNRLPNNEINSKLSIQQSSEDIRQLQKVFFDHLKNTPDLRNSENFTSTLTVLNSAEGQKLVKSLVDALVPTIGRDDSKELFQNFWLQLMGSVSPKVSKKIQKIEELYNEIDFIPLALANLLRGNENSPILQTLSEVFPNFNISEMFGTFVFTDDGTETDFVSRIIQLITPGVTKLLRDNNIDLQPDAVMQIISSLASQFQQTSGGSDKSLGFEKKPSKEGKHTKHEPNLLATLLPLMGMFGGGQGGKGNKLMENIMMMFNKNGDGGNSVMENIFSLMGNGNNMGGNNNLLESVMGILGGGKLGGGDNNMMSMMMAMMSGLGNQKKQNDNLNMLAMAMDLMSGGAGGKNKKNDMAGMAKMAFDMLGQMGKSNNRKEQNKKPNQIEESKQEKDRKNKIDTSPGKQFVSEDNTSPNLNPKSRLITLLEPALLQLSSNTACHAKLAAVMGAAKTMLDNKSMGVKAFLSAAVPVAVTGLPGGPAMLLELSSAWADMGLRDKDFSQVLASVKDEGECVSLSRRAAPHLGRLLLFLADPDVHETVTRVLGDQAKAALEGLGLKGVTLSNWQQLLGPMINMGAAGLPIQPLPLLAAAQDHLTSLAHNATRHLAQIRGSTLQQVVQLLESELGSLLHRLGAAEQQIRTQQNRGSLCLAQAVCLAAETETGIRAAILTSYSTARALLVSQVSVTARLTVLRAASSTVDCQSEFPCAALADGPTAGHYSLDYDEPAHQEL